MSVSEEFTVVKGVADPGPPADPGEIEPDAPLALEVRNLAKTFRVPEHRIDSFKERFVHPFRQNPYRELHALDDVSFDVRKGEFLGIVGRNGSGKSTLLKILASIYRADAGTIRLAGRLAPFIELGVGFDPNLSARENVVLNAVMMGLSPRDARTRVDAVFEFAELDDFREMKLKNYSSGMTVRLAFSVMLQADADVMLIDEVLAVGDASFQQKCADVFHEMRDSEKTVVLVTHDMGAVQTYCHRAMLMHDGKLIHVGDPEEVGKQYIRLNFAGEEERRKASEVTYVDGNPHWGARPDLSVKLIDAHLEDEHGKTEPNVEQDQPIRLRATIEARAELIDPVLAIHCHSADSVHVFSLHHGTRTDGGQVRIGTGERMELRATIQNQLVPGRYFLTCWATSHLESGERSAGMIQLLDFVVYGTPRELGTFYVNGLIEMTRSSAAAEETGGE
jgi:ABC-type polysaccharide/polyol phosphate transport system ATPase subunit